MFIKVALKTHKLILKPNKDVISKVTGLPRDFRLITIGPHGDKLKAIAPNASGKAYLQVVNYLSKIAQKDEPIRNLTLYITLSSISAIYDSEPGQQRIICFVNHQKFTRLGHTKVLDYDK